MPANLFDLSILIPTLGRKKEGLAALLSSIDQQQFKKSKIEVLLIQNGNAETLDLDFFKALFPDLLIQLHRITNLGINQARSMGLCRAQGHILLMLDDDVILPDDRYLLRLQRAHEDSPEVLAFGGCYRSMRNASLFDRIYNLDAHLSLRSAQRGAYSVDLLGGCVSYKKTHLDKYGLLPNSTLQYGATETEFHHRLFQVGALLKYQQNISVYHNPQMGFVEYCRKSYRQGHGFSRHCIYKSGAKKNISLSFNSRILLSTRELFYTWGTGELPLVRLLMPLRRVFGNIKNRTLQQLSNIKWRLHQYYVDHLNKRINKRTKHYGSEGTVLIGTKSLNSLSLYASWDTATLIPLSQGLDLFSSDSKAKAKLILDVGVVDNAVDLSKWILQHSDLPVALYCSNELLTPLELKRNVEKANVLLRQAKYKHKLKSIALIRQDHIDRWPEPVVLYENQNRHFRSKFSVVIPFYNNSLFLKRVLQSLCQQNYVNEKYEIILVSDGSDSEHVDAVCSYAAQNQQISISVIQWDKSLLDPKEFRAGMARQIGSMHARGEYLSFLDSDIIVQPDYLSELEKSFSIYDIIQAKRRMLDAPSTEATVRSDSLFTEVYKEDDYWENFKNNKSWEALWAYWKYTCTYSLSLKRERFFDLGGFRPQYNRYGFEDVDLGYRAYLAGLRFGYLDSDVFHLYPQGNGALHHFNAVKREALLVSSCETFYRLNFSPALYEEFEFFLRGRNFNYQSMKARDYIHLACWKDYFLSFQHFLRQYYWVFFWSMVRGCGRTYVFLNRAYYRYLRPFLMKPYYFTRYQFGKYALIAKVDKDGQHGKSL